MEDITWIDVFFDKVIIPVLGALGLAIATVVGMVVKRLADKIGIELKSKQKEEVDREIQIAIMHTMQTFTDAAHAAAADGKLTKEEAIAALSMTKERAVQELKSLGKAANGEAKRLIANSSLLEFRIEGLLPRVKAETSTGKIKTLSPKEAAAIIEGDEKQE